MFTTFRAAASAVHFDDNDAHLLALLAPLLVPHTHTLAESLTHVLEVDAEVLAWLARTLEGPWDEAQYAGSARIGGRCVERDIPWEHVFAAFSALRASCLDTVIAHAPACSVAAIRALDRVLDAQHLICLQVYSGRGASQRHAALQSLSAGLAHEVRNPLNSALLQLELLDRRLRRAHPMGDLAGPLASARHEIDRLGELVTEFVAFAQPTELAPLTADAAEIAVETTDRERELAIARGVSVVVATAPAIAQVDRDKLQLVIHHLVRNAIEATPAGGRVSVLVADLADSVQLSVRDTGAGIPAAVMARIYEPFYTTKDSGTGLGMSIVQSLVELHGGSVAIATSSRGTHVDVLLPKRQP